MEGMHNTCSNENCGCGCHSKWGGKGNHHLIRTILKLIIVIMIFWMGFKLGLLSGAIGGGYGRHMIYGGYNNMMNQQQDWNAWGMMKGIPDTTVKK